MTGSSRPGRSGSPWVGGVDDLVAAVPDGARLSVGGFHFTRAPVAALRALARRGVRDLTYVAWGGGLPLEILLSAGSVRRAQITFSSLDVFGLAPRFRAAAESGVLEIEEWTALGLIAGLRAAAENLAWEVLQEPAGSDLTAGFAERLGLPAGPGAPLVRVRPVVVDYLLLHAQRADDDGNVEIVGPREFDLLTAFAARHVLVTVEERVARGALHSPAAMGGNRSIVLPRSHVTAVALASFGAYPTSCLPYYGTDFRRLGSLAADAAVDLVGGLGEPSEADREWLRARAALPGARLAEAVREEAAEPSGPATADELMVVLLARTVDDASVCSMGSAAPTAAAAYLLAKATHAPDALLMSFNGGLVDIGPRPMTLGFAEQMDLETAVLAAGGDDTYHWYYQQGRVTHEAVGSAQIDRRGATNNLWVTRPDGRRIRLPGQGGMADVANLHRDFVIYLPRHDPRNTVEAVETISAMRAWRDPDLRRAYGLQPGHVRVLTNLCVLEINPESGELEVSRLHPGVELDQVQAATGFRLATAADLAPTVPPTPEALIALRRVVDPLGLRRLDFVPARERDALLAGILDREDAAAERLLGRQGPRPRYEAKEGS